MNKFISFVVTSLSLLIVLSVPGHSSIDNNNNESPEERDARLARQQQQLEGSATLVDNSSRLSLVPLTSSDKLGVEVPSRVPRTQSAPSLLSLRSSLQLQTVCRLFMTQSAAEEMNNVCTNLAYDQALRLYGLHGDRFVEPFSEHIHGMIFGILESSVKKAIGVCDLFMAINKLTGFNVTGQRYLTKAANRNLPQSVLNALRLKFATDLLNKHVVGPQVVAPNIAYAVNQMNFGQIIQEQVFARLCNILLSYEDELVDRSVLEMKGYAERIVALNEDLNCANECLLSADTMQADTLKAEIAQLNKDARAELNWTEAFNPFRDHTPKEAEVAQKGLMLAALEKDIREKQNKIKQVESDIKFLKSEGHATAEALIAAGRYNNQGQATPEDYEQAALLLQPTCTLRELFGELPYVGASIDRYMSPCPHIQPGYLSSLMTGENLSLVSYVPRAYLRLTGVIGSIERLREDLSPQAFTRTFDETVSKINNVRNLPARLGEVQFMPTEAQLEGKNSVIVGLRTIRAVAKGTRHAVGHVSEARTEAQSIHQPARDHLRRVQTHAQQGIVNLNIAVAPARVAYNAFVRTGQIWAVNFLSKSVVGLPVLDYLSNRFVGVQVSDNLYLIAFTLAIIQELYILLSYMI